MNAKKAKDIADKYQNNRDIKVICVVIKKHAEEGEYECEIEKFQITNGQIDELIKQGYNINIHPKYSQKYIISWGL